MSAPAEKKSNKKIIGAIILIAIIAVIIATLDYEIILNPTDSYVIVPNTSDKKKLSDYTLDDLMEGNHPSSSTQRSATYQQLAVYGWMLNTVLCMQIDNLEELQDFGESVQLDLEAYLLEVDKYEFTTSQKTKISSMMNMIDICIDDLVEKFK